MNSCKHNQVCNVCVVIAVIIPKCIKVKYCFFIKQIFFNFLHTTCKFRAESLMSWKLIFLSGQHSSAAAAVPAAAINNASQNYRPQTACFLSQKKMGYAAEVLNNVLLSIFFTFPFCPVFIRISQATRSWGPRVAEPWLIRWIFTQLQYEVNFTFTDWQVGPIFRRKIPDFSMARAHRKSDKDLSHLFVVMRCALFKRMSIRKLSWYFFICLLLLLQLLLDQR